MSQVKIVAPIYIQQIWESVEPYLSAALKHSGGEYGIEHLKVLLVRGEQSLLVSVNESNKINGAMTAEFINSPNARIMFITAVGGSGIVNDKTFSQVETWAKMQGATKASAYAQDSQARLFKIKLGLEKVTNVVEKDL